MTEKTSEIKTHIYTTLLGTSPQAPDSYRYMEAFDATSKDENGIPVSIAELSYKAADEFARIYDTEYDAAKAAFKAKGGSWTMMTMDDRGRPVAVNLLQLAAGARALRSALTFTDENPLVALSSFHALLVRHEWVFSHLCEASFALRNVRAIREATTKTALDDFKEFADTAAQAIHHYTHRHA